MATAQPAGTVEYAKCTSAGGGKTPLSNVCPAYDTKPADGEAQVLEPWGM